MPTKMQEIATKITSAIAIGGLITSLALALGLENKVATMEPIRASRPLDINSCLEQKFIKVKGQNEYFLMTNNQEVRSTIFPNPNHINVRDEANWLFPVETPMATVAYPTPYMRANNAPEGADTDEEYHFMARLLILSPSTEHR
ncbi:hypothetical protein KIW84_035438 [Lathyrus oleraceus]|uniref:Uncharacterized protein n=1 Tax=Pisum sativum TaxID=3888 RepID=A0A9D4Y283_PEA|nr:hypothetical protein KIW84_035438 [Pisum sativum]